MRPHEWFVEHALDYAAGTLDADDARAFEAHLDECEACQVAVARVESELRWLPMALAPATPRAGYQRRIVEGVLGRPARETSDSAAPAVGDAGGARGVAAARGGLWYLGSCTPAQRELESQRAAVAALRDTLSIMRAGRVLQADVEVGQTRGGILIFADEVTHRWNVVIHGLPPASAGHQYQFWFICGDGMVRGTEVNADIRKSDHVHDRHAPAGVVRRGEGGGADRGADRRRAGAAAREAARAPDALSPRQGFARTA